MVVASSANIRLSAPVARIPCAALALPVALAADPLTDTLRLPVALALLVPVPDALPELFAVLVTLAALAVPYSCADE
jgi:hypothetical protein